jgi:hypothetical protein
MQKHFSYPKKIATVTSIMVRFCMQSPCGLIMGSEEFERTFSTLAFTKTQLENSLCEHLHLVFKLFTLWELFHMRMP